MISTIAAFILLRQQAFKMVAQLSLFWLSLWCQSPLRFLGYYMYLSWSILIRSGLYIAWSIGNFNYFVSLIFQIYLWCSVQFFILFLGMWKVSLSLNGFCIHDDDPDRPTTLLLYLGPLSQRKFFGAIFKYDFNFII